MKPIWQLFNWYPVIAGGIALRITERIKISEITCPIVIKTIRRWIT